MSGNVSIEEMPDVLAFKETVRSSRDLFAADEDIFIARAPGRLDVMGGIADYSGSHVLEMPVAEAALVALQKDEEPIIRIVSLGGEENDRTHAFEMPIGDLCRGDEQILYSEAHEYFGRNISESWAAYIAGAFLVLMRERGVRFDRGSRILIDSKVPEGKGVSSSAAIEVAAMSAISAAFDLGLEARELALLCQKVENLVVGAPCGIMDQMSSAAGEQGRLLSMVCQPAELLGSVAIPDEIAFWGIDSGIRHSVGAGDYGSVRTGAFMGYRIITDLAGLKVTETDGAVNIDDPKWNGYLANITPVEFEENFATHLPQKIAGADFLSRYRGITDSVTTVDPGKLYDVFYPTKHPVYENDRVVQFGEMLSRSTMDLDGLGELMYGSHQSYSDCGLGTSGTDLIVDLVRRSPNLVGARMTGGGSGGTVAVLGRKDAVSEIEEVAAEYERQTGHKPHIFSGSSTGASAFGHLRMRI